MGRIYFIILIGLVLILLVAVVRAQQAVRTVQFTEPEIAATIEMLDLACKAGGLRVCRNALVIVDKLQAAPKGE